MNTREEYEQLKRNNRRRLIGAIVVVAVAAFILLKVLSHRSAEVPPATVEIAHSTASETSTTVLPNPLGASETQPASDILTPLPEMPASGAVPDDLPEIVTPPQAPQLPAETTPPEQPVIKPAPKADKPVKAAPPKLTPQEILEGKAGKPAAAPRTGEALIQAGAFTSAQQAETQRSRLAQIGVSAKVHRATTAKGEVYRVRIGPFASRDEAQRTLAKIRANGFDGILVSQ